MVYVFTLLIINMEKQGQRERETQDIKGEKRNREKKKFWYVDVIDCIYIIKFVLMILFNISYILMILCLNIILLGWQFYYNFW